MSTDLQGGLDSATTIIWSFPLDVFRASSLPTQKNYYRPADGVRKLCIIIVTFWLKRKIFRSFPQVGHLQFVCLVLRLNNAVKEMHLSVRVQSIFQPLHTEQLESQVLSLSEEYKEIRNRWLKRQCVVRHTIKITSKILFKRQQVIILIWSTQIELHPLVHSPNAHSNLDH